MKVILLIEDSLDIRENISEILELEGFHVLTAENGELGVEIAQRKRPDLILCDINMPVLDGFGVLLNINKNVKTAGIPFIFLTGQTELSDKKNSLTLGADDYITKPFDPEVLLASIHLRIQNNEKAQQAVQRELSLYVQELENMLHMTNHRVRAPLCTSLGLLQLLEEDQGQYAKDRDNIMAHLKENILRLDTFTKELTDFLQQAREKRRGLGS